MSVPNLITRIFDRLSSLPLLGALVGVLLGLAMVRFDRRAEDVLPDVLLTTVDSSRAVLSAVAGGLISTITLLLTLTLVAVQVGSSRYSPRTLRSWLRDRALQLTIAAALGTTSYCLVVLREVRSVEDGEAITPHAATLLGLVAAILTLGLVVWSVGRLADSLSVDSVAQSLLAETLAVVNRIEADRGPVMTNHDPRPGVAAFDPPSEGRIVEAGRAGWVTAVDTEALRSSCPDGVGVRILARVGSFVLDDAPVAVVLGADGSIGWVRDAIVIGPARSATDDVGFGILRLVDVALRALSPGVNDPNTAIDIINHLGTIAVRLHGIEAPEHRWVEGDRWIEAPPFDRDEHLRGAFDAIRRSATGEPGVAVALIDTLGAVRREVRRRGLVDATPGIDLVLTDLAEELRGVRWIERDLALAERALEATGVGDAVRIR